MSAEKRPASNVFGSSQMVVKRQKSDANLGNGSAVSVVIGGSASGPLVQGVSPSSLLNRHYGKMG
jgi:Prp8 binding protein